MEIFFFVIGLLIAIILFSLCSALILDREWKNEKLRDLAIVGLCLISAVLGELYAFYYHYRSR